MSDSSPLVLIAFPCLPAIADKAQQLFNSVIVPDEVSTGQLLALIQQKQPAAVLVTFSHKLNAAFINALPASVRMIATCSVGTDHIDIAAAKARGIQLSNTPDVLTECTADMALLLLLNASRRGREYQAVMDNGWGVRFGQSEMLGHSLRGKTLGILGMGRIGQAVAERARAFGMQIIYNNRRPLPAAEEQGAVYYDNFEAMLPHCDVLSLHAPGTVETRHIINDKTLSLLPDGAMLINVARGSLVDETALMQALTSGKLFAAGLDVFEQEPEYNQQLKAFPNLFLTPHMGSATVETRTEMGMLCLQNIQAALAGKPLLTPC
ncbi:D-glycerate dehydrogenase [Chromatiaceae bacterium AAb-1]|nr:D-glycerate dehydrogenase [Chromatiaceae bacterium AAb-1]